MFDFDQTCQIAFTQKCKICHFYASCLLYICMKCLSENSKLKSISVFWSLLETGTSYGEKVVCTDTPGKNIWQKVKKKNAKLTI